MTECRSCKECDNGCTRILSLAEHGYEWWLVKCKITGDTFCSANGSFPEWCPKCSHIPETDAHRS